MLSRVVSCFFVFYSCCVVHLVLHSCCLVLSRIILVLCRVVSCCTRVVLCCFVSSRVVTLVVF